MTTDENEPTPAYVHPDPILRTALHLWRQFDFYDRVPDGIADFLAKRFDAADIVDLIKKTKGEALTLSLKRQHLLAQAILEKLVEHREPKIHTPDLTMIFVHPDVTDPRKAYQESLSPLLVAYEWWRAIQGGGDVITAWQGDAPWREHVAAISPTVYSQQT